MTKKQRAVHIIDGLKKAYPLAECTLDYDRAYELLIAVRLAAQCTDARVNVVTAELFRLYPTLESIAAAAREEIEAVVRPCGLGNTKARDIVATARLLMAEYGGKVPDTMEELLKLPGVGRKSANLILGDVFGKPAVVVDTHCIRITNLMGLSEGKNPAAVEKQLRAILPPGESNDFCHRLVMHGRAVCIARRPRCGECGVAAFCEFAGTL